MSILPASARSDEYATTFPSRDKLGLSEISVAGVSWLSPVTRLLALRFSKMPPTMIKTIKAAAIPVCHRLESFSEGFRVRITSLAD
jgi:hypothetical protein